MSLTNAKHVTGEIEGARCTIIESGVTPERASFLRQLLEFNGFEVMEMKLPMANEGDEAKYIIGTTDLVFNPVFAVYECLLKIPEGGYVTPGYWNQECLDCDPRYWMRRKAK